MLIRSKLRLTLAAVAFLLASGCSPREMILKFSRVPEAHVPPGVVAEIREPVVVCVWVHDAKNGGLKKAYVKAQAGWLVGPDTPPSTAPIK